MDEYCCAPCNFELTSFLCLLLNCSNVRFVEVCRNMWETRNGELLYATGTRGLTVVELLPRSQTVSQLMMAGRFREILVGDYGFLCRFPEA